MIIDCCNGNVICFLLKPPGIPSGFPLSTFMFLRHHCCAVGMLNGISKDIVSACTGRINGGVCLSLGAVTSERQSGIQTNLTRLSLPVRISPITADPAVCPHIHLPFPKHLLSPCLPSRRKSPSFLVAVQDTTCDRKLCVSCACDVSKIIC